MKSPDEPRKLVLVVDDDPHARAIHAAWLTHAGYRVAEAASGTEALTLVDEALPDLFLVDLKMPGMDGWTLLESLRADPRTESSTIVALTIVAPGEDRRNALRRGFDEHWVKPLPSATLLARTQRLIGPP